MRSAVGAWCLALLITNWSLAQPDSAPPTKFEVLVLGTLHAPWQFRAPGFTPAHVRAALINARPDVIGVESNPTWFAAGRFHDVTWEAQGVAVPWARQNGLPVHGVDWMDVGAFDRLEVERLQDRHERLCDERARGPLGAWHFGHIPTRRVARLLEFWTSPDHDFAVMNGIDGDAFGKRWLGEADPASPNFGGRRNREIAKRCVEVMKAHPGGRLVVVIGAGHKAVLDAMFARQDGVKVLKLGEDVPVPTSAQVEQAWTTKDLLCVLGHNLDGERSYLTDELVDFDRMRSVLKRYEASGGDGDVASYFRARIRQRCGQLEPALEAYGRLVQSKRTPLLYPYPLGHWRMHYGFEAASRLEMARVLPSPGRKEEVAEALRGIVESLPAEPVVAIDPTTRPLTPFHALPDGGCEGGTDGWRTSDPKMLSLSPSTHEPAQGTGCLHLLVRGRRNIGLPAATTHLRLPKQTTAKTQLTFSVAIRGSMARVALAAYVPRDEGRRLSRLAKGRARYVSSWRRRTLTFDLPAGENELLLYVYVDGNQGARVWIDDARLQRGEPPLLRVPRAWDSIVLAREYLRRLTR